MDLNSGFLLETTNRDLRFHMTRFIYTEFPFSFRNNGLYQEEGESLWSTLVQYVTHLAQIRTLLWLAQNTVGTRSQSLLVLIFHLYTGIKERWTMVSIK